MSLSGYYLASSSTDSTHSNFRLGFNAPWVNDQDVDEDDDDFQHSFTSTEYAKRTNFNNEHSNSYRKSHEMGALSFALTLDVDNLDTDSDDEEDSAAMPSQQLL